MPGMKLSTTELENAAKIIEEQLRSDCSRIPDLDVALISSGGKLTPSTDASTVRVLTCLKVQIHHQLHIQIHLQMLGYLS